MQLVREGHAEARRLIGGLRPPQLEEGGVLAAIESLVEECNKRNKVKIEFRSNVAQLELAPMLENTVFRIVQECLTNACRHSKSKKVKVELTQHDDQLRIEVRDWGVGFKVDRVGEGHFGLEGIQERAKVFGGRAIIKSSLGKGTTIIVELPCRLPVFAAESPQTMVFVHWSRISPARIHLSVDHERTLCGRRIPGNAIEFTRPSLENAVICKPCQTVERERETIPLNVGKVQHKALAVPLGHHGWWKPRDEDRLKPELRTSLHLSRDPAPSSCRRTAKSGVRSIFRRERLEIWHGRCPKTRT